MGRDGKSVGKRKAAAVCAKQRPAAAPVWCLVGEVDKVNQMGSGGGF